MRYFVIEANDEAAAILEAAGRRELDQAAMARLTAVEKPPYHVPGPYEIALAAACALISAGQAATPGAAMQAGWAAVPEFFIGRDWYLRELAPALDLASGKGGPSDGTTGAAV